MSKKRLYGYVAAFIPNVEKGGKSSYPRVGVAFLDDQDRISIKIDTLPFAGSRWDGWLNVFPPNDKDKPAAEDKEGHFQVGSNSDPF